MTWPTVPKQFLHEQCARIRKLGWCGEKNSHGKYCIPLELQVAGYCGFLGADAEAIGAVQAALTQASNLELDLTFQ